MSLHGSSVSFVQDGLGASQPQILIRPTKTANGPTFKTKFPDLSPFLSNFSSVYC